MPIQVLVKDIGGTLETEFLEQRPTACTVTVYTDTGGKKVDTATATVDSVSTTVSSAVAAGATTVALADATSVVSGRRYMLGVTASTAAQEVVTAKSLSASTVTLWHPTVFAHNSGDAFRCGRVTYSVTSTSADATWFDGWATFTPTPTTMDPITETVDCAKRKIPDVLIDKNDVLLVFPEGQKMLEAKLDLPRALGDARDKFLQDIGGKVRVHTMLGRDHFRRPCALKFWLMRRHAFGDEWIRTMDKMQDDYEHEIAKLQSQVPVDEGQDDTTSGAFDGGITTGIIQRA